MRRIGGITRSTRPGFADSHEFRLPQTEGIPVAESTPQLNLRMEQRLAELTAKHVQLTHNISGYSAEQIRDTFGESRYEDLKNVDLSIRGLEGFVNKFIRDAELPHPYLKAE
ncbi:hypothetical protein [Klebsiella pneumoniae]|uniref:hypothetical protein n=1 Tax=Klebsiella pneumoniae TaxID=573 RepID=UPI00187B20F8|nr:hypothetical protein [Klebsiella pneumoniae]